MRPHRPDSDQRSPSSSTTNGYSASSPLNVCAGGVPGIRQRTRPRGERVWESRPPRAAPHGSLAGGAARRRCRLRTAGSATHWSSCSRRTGATRYPSAPLRRRRSRARIRCRIGPMRLRSPTATTSHSVPGMDLDAIVARALEEDVGAGDVTTRATVPPGARARARITQKQPGVLSGLAAAEATFRRLDPGVCLERRAQDGARRDGGPVLDIEGTAAGLLTAERTALNFLQRMSGVATTTARYVDAVAGTG